MKSLKAAELRKLSHQELQQTLKEQQERLFTLRQNQALRKLTDTSSIAVTRNNVARIMTIITEKSADA